VNLWCGTLRQPAAQVSTKYGGRGCPGSCRGRLIPPNLTYQLSNGPPSLLAVEIACLLQYETSFEAIESLGGPRGPSTPSKRPRISESANEPANPLDRDTTPPDMAQTGRDLLPPEHPIESASVPASPPLTAARPDDSPLGSARPLTSDAGPRPHRNRHPPKNGYQHRANAITWQNLALTRHRGPPHLLAR